MDIEKIMKIVQERRKYKRKMQYKNAQKVVKEYVQIYEKA